MNNLCLRRSSRSWQNPWLLRDAAAPLSSLAYFKPVFHSLHKPHHILWTPRANPYEVAKAVIPLRMLSGRYRVAMLTRHWSPSRSSSCPASDCQEEETLEHLLVFCKHYDHARVKLRRLWESCREPPLTDLITKVLYGPHHITCAVHLGCFHPPNCHLPCTDIWTGNSHESLPSDQNMVLHSPP